METKTYYFQPDKKFKQGYTLTDENKNVVIEAKMTKFTLIFPFKFQFTNHITNVSEEHKVSHTVTLEENGMIGFFSTKSSFKFDGKKIWDYLHEKGIRINSKFSTGKIGMTYEVSLKGQPMATIATATPNNRKFFITSDFCYNITTAEENLDLAFLAAFAFARTNQTFYH